MAVQKFIPTTVTRNRRVIETAAEYTLSMKNLIDAVVAEKIENPGQLPLLLHFWDRHYSALLHTGRTSQLPDFEEEVDSKETQVTILANGNATEPSVTPDTTTLQQLVTWSAPVDDFMDGQWDLETWTGAPDKVWAASKAYTVHLDIQHDLHVLITVDKQHLRRSLEVDCRALVLRHPTAEQNLALVGGQTVLPALPTTPPAGIRSISDVARKRSHNSSPDERVSTGGVVRSKHTEAIIKKGRNDTTSTSITKDEDYERIDRDDWAATWEALAQEWPYPGNIPFPTARSSTTEWQRVTRHASDLLLWNVKSFIFPGELLQILDVSVFEQWMTDRRRACLEDGLKKYCEQPMNRPTQRWIDRWIATYSTAAIK